MTTNTLEAYYEGGKAIFWLFVGYVLSLVSYYIIPPILELFTTEGVYTLLLFVFWGIALIAWPGYHATRAIQTIGTDGKNRIIGAVWIVFALIISYYGWYLIPATANILPDSTLAMMYWIGFVVVWTMVALVMPIMGIIKASG